MLSDAVTLDDAPDASTPHIAHPSGGDAVTHDATPDVATNHIAPPCESSDAVTYDATPDVATGHIAQNSHDDSDAVTYDATPDVATPHIAPVVVGLDWERDGWRVSIGGSDAEKVTRDELLSRDFPEADAVVVEQAHMKERNVYSVAQVYTADELASLPFKGKIRLFPGMPGQLARASRDVGHITDKLDKYGNPVPDKKRDAETMAIYAAKYPERLASWKKFRLPHEDPARRQWEYRDALREDLKDVLNPLRSAWNPMSMPEKYALPEVARFCELLEREFDNLTPGIKEQFGIHRTRNGMRVERMSPAITLYLCVYDREGNLRVRPDGEFIGLRFILKTIGLCNSYRPNMARSQLTHYGMRHYKGGRDGGYRSEYMRNLKQFLAIMRDASDAVTYDATPDVATEHIAPGEN